MAVPWGSRVGAAGSRARAGRGLGPRAGRPRAWRRGALTRGGRRWSAAQRPRAGTPADLGRARGGRGRRLLVRRHRRAAHAPARRLRAVLQPGGAAGHRHRDHAAGGPHAAAGAAGNLRPGRVLALEDHAGLRAPRLVGTHGQPHRRPPGRNARPGPARLRRGGHGRDRLHAGRLWRHARHRRLGLRRRRRAARGALPGREPQPDQRGAALPRACLEQPGAPGPRRAAAGRGPPVQQPDRPAERQRGHAHAGSADGAARPDRRPPRAARRSASRQRAPESHVGRLPGGKPVRQPRRTDRAVRRWPDRRRPGSNAALRQVPAIRASVAAVGREAGASAYGVIGEAPAATT
jgi:hypothetical protein